MSIFIAKDKKGRLVNYGFDKPYAGYFVTVWRDYWGFPPKLTKYINNDVLQSIVFEIPRNPCLILCLNE